MKIKINALINMGVILLFLISSVGFAQEKNPYNPEPLMKQLKAEKGKNPSNIHFLVFGDSKGSKYFPHVLKRADSLQPDFCITTADLVNKGGGANERAQF